MHVRLRVGRSGVRGLPPPSAFLFFSRNARRHRYSAGRPCWTKTERQGLVDGALGPANGVRDVSTWQASTAAAARDGAEPLAQPAVLADVQLAAYTLRKLQVIGKKGSELQ